MKVVVIGGRGLIGGKLVNKLRKNGHEAVAASPSTGVNSVTGQGLAEALKGAAVVVADFSTEGNKIRLPPVLIQPMAADDIASAVGRIAMGSPVNGTVEVGGPERFRLDELIRRGLASREDPRQVIADPHARYYGVEVSESTLVPRDDARLGETGFADWLSQSARQIPNTNLQPTIG